MVDYMTGILHDPWKRIHMGVTAENVAERYNVSRADQDALALEGQQRAAQAIAEDASKSQIVPVEIKTRKGVVMFDTDEHVRADVTAEALAKMKPAFKEGGSVTPGNASGINDGAAALVLAEAGKAAAMGQSRWRAWSATPMPVSSRNTPGIGPIPAVRLVMQRTGLNVSDMDVIEANEGRSPRRLLAVAKGTTLRSGEAQPEQFRRFPRHPVGATGAIISVKAIYELHRAAAAMRWSPCASAAGKASPPSTNVSESEKGIC